MKKWSRDSQRAIRINDRQTGLAPSNKLPNYFPSTVAPSISDPDDEKFIECAVAASADYLVTGDKAHLLSVKEAAGVPIVSVADFLRLLGAPENPT